MKTVAIIAEYNPFHNGHLYQINKIKEIFSGDTAVIAIMSGNYTQRGEMAFADKLIRARCAVDSGIDLVLELPFPFSISSAEFFAKSGVKIANSIGIVDYLAFGCELSNPNELLSIAKNMSSELYLNELHKLTGDSNYKKIGYPKLCEIAYCNCFGIIENNIFKPNNILAFEYVKAIISSNSQIKPLPLKRVGAGYNDSFNISEEFQNASAIRKLFDIDCNSALKYIPDFTHNHITDAIKNGEIPTNESLMDRAVISNFRINPPESVGEIHDAEGGLYNRLYEASYKTNSISSLTEITETKKFTKARIRRAIWYSYFGVTSSEVRSSPAYTQVLAMNNIGRYLLKEIKKVSDFPVITKPSAVNDLEFEVIKQKNLSNMADSVFALARKKPINAKSSLIFTPYVKK